MSFSTPYKQVSNLSCSYSSIDGMLILNVQVQLPTDVSDDVDEDPTGNKALWDRGLLNGATQKAESVVNFHVGEVITSLQKATLIPGGSESLVYTTLSGAVGMLIPFSSNEVCSALFLTSPLPHV